MKYGESIGFVSEKLKKIIADFHVLRLFIPKKLDLSKKQQFRLSRAVVRRNLCLPTASPLIA
jgi:hypothetical protein